MKDDGEVRRDFGLHDDERIQGQEKRAEVMPNDNGTVKPVTPTPQPVPGDKPDCADEGATEAIGEEHNAVSDPLRPLKAHPVYSIIDSLVAYMGVEKDLIQLAEFLSLGAGRMVMPINLDILTDYVAVDLYLANRILDLCHENVARVDTHRQFRALEQAEYLDGPDENLRPLAAILIRGNHRLLHREVSEYTARLLGADFNLPSLWRISDLLSSLPPVPSTLRLQATQANRNLDDFGSSFAGYRYLPAENDLARLIESLPIQPRYKCPFRPQYRGKTRPEMMLVFERFLAVFVSLRINIPGATDKRLEILPDDYRAVRALLTCLPLVPLDRELSPQALMTGEAIYEAAHRGHERIELPDLSQYGAQWFTRGDAMRWTDLGYNTLKKHLGELEGEGIVLSTLAQNNRERGRQIHFRFADGRAPPFEWKNPFEGLPELVAPIET